MEPIRKITNEQKDKALGHLFPSLLPFHNFDFVSPLHHFFSVFQLLSVFDNFSSHLYIFYFTFYILTCWDISNSTFKQQSTINLIWFWTQFWVNSINPFFFLLGSKMTLAPVCFSSFLHIFMISQSPDFCLISSCSYFSIEKKRWKEIFLMFK